MAVKFSDFTQKQLVTEVTNMVGYLATGELNIMIPPGNLDTTYAYSTTDGASPALTLQGTKPNQPSITPSTVTLSGLGGTILAGTGTNAITFRSTTYILAAGTNADPAVNTPITLTGNLGGDPHTDTVNLIGTGTVQITSTGGVITIDGGSTGDVTSLNLGTVAVNTTGLTGSLTITPNTGAVTIASNTYNGGNNIGIVPSGGSATTFLQGDGNWATPTDTDTTYTLPITGSSAAVTATLTGTTGTPDPVLITGGTNVTFSSVTSAGFTIDAAGGAGGVTSVDETTPGTSSGTPIVVNPTTGTVLVQSMAFDGAAKVGHVPTSAAVAQTTHFLRADGTWQIAGGLPTKTVDTVTISGTSTNTLDVTSPTDPSSVNYIDVYINGVYQAKANATLSAKRLTLAAGFYPDGAIIETVTTT
jgi:hypothetical protein